MHVPGQSLANIGIESFWYSRVAILTIKDPQLQESANILESTVAGHVIDAFCIMFFC